MGDQESACMATWDTDHTYVIGHQRPDSDAISSALGYAWYLQQSGRTEVLPARCGNPGSETLYALQRFEQEPPLFLASVWATFGHAQTHVAPIGLDKTLGEATGRMAEGARAVPVIDANGHPHGMVTPATLARAFLACPGDPRQEPVAGLVDQVPVFQAEDRISDLRQTFVRSDCDDFLVVDGSGAYLGVVPRYRLLSPPKARLILVDHNELPQAVPGAEEAEILAVLDHHKLGNPTTEKPIEFTVQPIGCTCTLVWEMCLASALIPPRRLMGMLLTGILSDTLGLRSPTTTARDRKAAGSLGGHLELDVPTYSMEMLSQSPGLGAPLEEVLDGDRKAFRIGGLALSLAQVEVTTLQDLSEHKESILEGMRARLQSEGLHFFALMVTDVVEACSKLLWVGEKRVAVALPFARDGSHQMDLGEIVSRKKQLLPAFYSALESV